MAFDAEIFSYSALHNFVASLEDPDLKKILGVVETRNFELIMQQLDTFSTLVTVFGDYPDLKARIDAASSKLKQSLIDAVKAMHPEHVYRVAEEQSASCSEFLNHFLKSGGSIFSTNYDLLLYWVLLRSSTVEHCDGFGRELENPDEVERGEDEIWSELVWGKNRDEQNTFYLHGALPFFDTGVNIVKEEYDGARYLLQNISDRMEAGDYPVFVTAGNGQEKLAHIKHNPYLTWCYDKFTRIDGSLVSFGFNFGPYDDHITAAINRAAKQPKTGRLWSIYIGVYSDADREHIESIESDFGCKVHIFDAKSAPVWTGVYMDGLVAGDQNV